MAVKKTNWGTIAKLSSIIVFVGGTLVSLTAWTVTEIRSSAKLEAEVEYMKKYEGVITDNIILRANCGVRDTTRR